MMLKENIKKMTKTTTKGLISQFFTYTDYIEKKILFIKKKIFEITF
jgi:hypothetical protein